MLPPTIDRRLWHIYEMAEQRYLRSLPPEHFMEATPQATQRKITLESFDLIHAKRPEVQIFNELLVQYRRGPDDHKPGQVVPDNMVVIHGEPIMAKGSFNVPLQPVGPFLVLEYVSKESKRKDYEESYHKYEKELKVPHYLVFYPEVQELSLFRLGEHGYTSTAPDDCGHYAIPELELGAAIHEEWVRFWYKGELLPLPGDLMRDLEATQEELADTQEELAEAKNRLTSVESRLQAEVTSRQSLEDELVRMREEMARLQANTR